MKKIIAFVAILAITFVACKKDDDNSGTPTGGGGGGGTTGVTVVEKNMGLYNKLTATWCGPCGQWGWTLNTDIIALVETNAVLMGTYASSSSGMYNATAGALKTAFSPASGWPDFCANGKQKTQFSGTGGIYTSLTKDSVVAEINRHVNAAVMVNSGYNTKIENDTLTITAKVQFFQDMPATSKYYIGAYVIEDGVMSIQSGQTGTVAHHHVLRGSVSSTTWGAEITSGNTAGSTFDQTFKMAIPSSWNQANLEVATIIWEKVGSTYKFVNAYRK